MRESEVKRNVTLSTLRSRAHRVATVLYSEKTGFARHGDAAHPIVEEIRTAGIGKPADECVEEAVGILVRHGRNTGTIEKAANAFFWKINGQDENEKPLLDSGQEITRRIMEVKNEGSTIKLASSVVAIFADTGNEAAVISVIDTFHAMLDISDGLAHEFLRMATLIAHKERDSTAQFAELMAMQEMAVCFRAFRGKTVAVAKEGGHEEIDLGSWFMKGFSNLALAVKNTDVVRDAALAALVVYGNLGPEYAYKYVDGIALIAAKAKNPDTVSTAAGISSGFANEGKRSEMDSLFEKIRNVVNEGADENETAVGVTIVCIVAGRKPIPAQEEGKEENGKDGLRFESISNISLDGEVPSDMPSETTYPDIEIESHEKELPEIAKPLRERISGLMGDVAAGVFAEKVRSAEGNNVRDICANYGRILDVVEKTAKRYDDALREEYLGLAADLFIGMKNELPFAPLAYQVLGEWAEIGSSAADSFIANIIRVKDNEALAGMCRNNRPMKG
ncbi:hypothetical protein H0O02_01970 [Candidatus Micrarchaeota archaeon]|nr:hypothetical protein [Candidatus Micrarchaeota archaeon]